MKASPEQVAILGNIARRLGDLREEVVFVGGMIRGLLISDLGASGARSTDDVDLIVEVASTVEYQTQLSKRLRTQGFREDASEGAPTCRWLVDGVKVDVMPTNERVLGFSNPWYGHAIATANTVALPPDLNGEISIRVVSAPAFCATKLVAFSGRGGGDLYHHDMEDFVAVVDGRAELLAELECGDAALRAFVAGATKRLLDQGLEEALPGLLEGDAASQARLPYVVCTLKRIARNAKVVTIGEKFRAGTRGDPGATSVDPGSSWDWSILAVEAAMASKAPIARHHVAVIARLANHGMTAGTAGDGRNVFVEDGTGRRFPPLYKLLHAERAARAMPDPYGQILPKEAFETVWVYEIPDDTTRLRLQLPFDDLELPFEHPRTWKVQAAVTRPQEAITAVLNSAPPSAALEIVRRDLLISQALHTYELQIRIENTSRRRIDEWYMDMEIPRELVPQPSTHAAFLPERSTDARVFFRTRIHTPLLAGDHYTFKFQYSVDREFFAKYRQLWDDWSVRVRAYVAGTEVAAEEFSDLQEF